MAKKDKTTQTVTKQKVNAFFAGCTAVAEQEEKGLPAKLGIPFRSKMVRNKAALAPVIAEIESAFESHRLARLEVMKSFAIKDDDDEPVLLPSKPGTISYNYGDTPVSVIEKALSEMPSKKEIEDLLEQEETVSLSQIETAEFPPPIEHLFEHFEIMISDFIA